MGEKYSELRDTLVDYYKILECNKNASIEELKKSYQRLILTSHPDKVCGGNEFDTFCLIQKAWSVLKDPQTRKLYDAELCCYEHSDLLVHDNISLSDMSYNSHNNIYTYNCRCGGVYMLDLDNKLDYSKVFINCDECSLSIEVCVST